MTPAPPSLTSYIPCNSLNFFYLTALLKEWGRKATCGENFDFQVKHIKKELSYPNTSTSNVIGTRPTTNSSWFMKIDDSTTPVI